MTDHSATAAALRSRLAELDGAVRAIDSTLSAPLDADFAEQAAELAAQDALAPLESAHIAEANSIRAALTRIETGSYGVCTNCGCDIPAARLAAMPTAMACVACANG